MDNIKRSEQIGQLAAALSAAQAEIRGAAKDSTNPHFQSQYADLASVWDACRETLTKNGLAVIQLPAAEGSKVTVTTILTHKSGEWISDDLTLTASQGTPQGIGSAITYGRRYALSAMVGVAPDDDDGEAAEGRGTGNGQPQQQPPKPQPQQRRGPQLVPDRISDAEQKQIFALMESAGKTQEQVKAIIEEHGFKRTADITRDKFGAICDQIREI